VDASRRLAQLAKLPTAERPVVSVYLDTRWTDEQQRERVRIFLRNNDPAARPQRSMPVLRRFSVARRDR